MATRNNGTETNDPAVKLANTVYSTKMFVQYNGLGQVIPLQPTEKVVGLALEAISTDSTNFAINDVIAVDRVTSTTDRFLMPVGTGTATSAMVGSTFDIDADSESLDVSGAGTQFTMTKFIADDLVEVEVVLLA